MAKATRQRRQRRPARQRPPECIAIDQLRLDRGWTWETLAEKMHAAHVPVPPTTLYHILKAPVQPHDRTLHKLRKFLAHARRARWIAAGKGASA